jgi:hypothetical protein
MTSRKLKTTIALLLANAGASAGYVVALAKGKVALPGDARAWTDVLPDFAFIILFSFLAAYGIARRRTWGFALGMVSAGAYIGGSGTSVVRFGLHVSAQSAGTPVVVPWLAVYFTFFGLALAIYLWTRRHVFAVGV